MGKSLAEQLMLRYFTFYNPDAKCRINELLENRGFIAILAATSYNPETEGRVYSFLLIKDGDFNLPGAHMTDREWERLLAVSQEDHSLLLLNDCPVLAITSTAMEDLLNNCPHP